MQWTSLPAYGQAETPDNSQLFEIHATSLGQFSDLGGRARIRKSTYKVCVSYDRMTAELQRIKQQGGVITQIVPVIPKEAVAEVSPEASTEA